MVLSRLRPVALAVVAPLIAGTACGDDDERASADDRATVVATTSVWADVVDAATCRGDAGVEVTSILPAGTDPHHYEASLRDRETLDEADLVVSNGRALEEGLASLLEDVDADRHLAITELPGVTEPHGADDHDHDHEDGEDGEDGEGGDHGHGHDHGAGDPHVWLDPQLVAATITPMIERIVDATGVPARRVEACAAGYVADLRELDRTIAEQVEALPSGRRVLVTGHDSYGYFADRYGFEVVGTVIPSTSTMAETNPADLEELRQAIDDAGVTAIFVDAHNSGTEAHALADRIGDIQVVTLNTGSVGDGTDNDTYLTMMESNTALIVDALGAAQE